MPAVPYFNFLHSTRPQPYLSRTLIQHLQQCKTTAVPCFRAPPNYSSTHTLLFFLNNLRPQPYLSRTFILAFAIISYPSRTLFQHFKQIKTSAVPYFSFLNNISPQPYLSSFILFWDFQSYKTPSAPYLSILKRLKLGMNLLFWFLNIIRPQPYLSLVVVYIRLLGEF